MENDVKVNWTKVIGMVKTGLVVLAIVFAGLWAIYRPVLVENLSADFVTKAELQTHEVGQTAQMTAFGKQLNTMDSKLDTIISKNNLTDAYSIVNGISADIDRHESLKNDSQAWAEQTGILAKRLDKAVEYKDCIVGARLGCKIIQDQIFQ